MSEIPVWTFKEYTPPLNGGDIASLTMVLTMVLLQVRCLVLAAPGLLGLKPLDLESKWKWFEQVGAGKEEVLASPQCLETGLVSVRRLFLSLIDPLIHMLLSATCLGSPMFARLLLLNLLL